MRPCEKSDFDIRGRLGFSFSPWEKNKNESHNRWPKLQHRSVSERAFRQDCADGRDKTYDARNRLLLNLSA